MPIELFKFSVSEYKTFQSKGEGEGPEKEEDLELSPAWMTINGIAAYYMSALKPTSDHQIYNLEILLFGCVQLACSKITEPHSQADRGSIANQGAHFPCYTSLKSFTLKCC